MSAEMPNSLGSLAGYAISDEEHEDDQFHKLSGNISGSDDDNSTSSHPSRNYSPVIREEGPPKKQMKVSNLVSYGNNENEPSSDEEGSSNEDGPGRRGSEAFEPHEDEFDYVEHRGDSLIPPSPTGQCDLTIQENIRRMLKRQQEGHFSLDTKVQRAKSFRNPSIYEKLISHVDLNEKGTNYPPELYDPSIWSSSSFYDDLARQQNAEMEKRKADKKDRAKIDFVTAVKPSSDQTDGSGGRKSKWDTSSQSAGSKSSGPPPVGSLIKKK